jgi:hypothetical protein
MVRVCSLRLHAYGIRSLGQLGVQAGGLDSRETTAIAKPKTKVFRR